MGTYCFAQGPVKQAQQRMEKGKWSAARQNLVKALSKDSLNTEAHFVFAKFFFERANPHYHLDSSYLFINRTLADFTASSVRQRERLKRLFIDSASIISFRSRVDSTAFEEAKRANSEEEYNHFLSVFTFYAQPSKAVELRNEVAFLEALRTNSKESYRAYLDKYPESIRAQEASARFEKILFDEHTSDGKLASYQGFIKKFPATTFRPLIEQRIFEISTASGRKEDFASFISAYPDSHLRQRALRMLYFISDRGATMPGSLLNDSLRHLQKLGEGYWVPFLKNGLFGFMNQDGHETVEPKFASVLSDYLCGPVYDDFIITSSGLFARSGIALQDDSVTEAHDLGFGFLKVVSPGCTRVFQKAGFQLTSDCIDEARLIVGKFMALKKNNLWGLFAFNGLSLLPFQYQDIFAIDNIVVLVRTGKKILVKPEDIAATANRHPLKEDLVFDDVRTWGAGDLHVKNSALEGVLNQDLQFAVPFDRQKLTKTSFGFIQEKEGRLKIVGSPELLNRSFERVNDLGGWLELYQSPNRLLYQISSGRIIDHDLDSLWLRNKVLFSIARDTLHVYGGQGKMASFARSSTVQFINSRDTAIFFQVLERNKKTVFEATASRKLFTADFDEVEHVGAGIFLFSKNKKKGLLSADGKTILPPQYDIIVYSTNGFLSLYKDKKFGLFEMATRKLIKPEYERNVVPYATGLFIAYRNGAYGFISPDEKPLSEFHFDEIRYWNDSAAMVRRNFMWQIYSIASREVKLDRIRAFEVIAKGNKETIVRIHRENYYGVVSSTRGTVIPPSFTEVINVGSVDKPLYFTEKRVEEADIFVVIYYDYQGRFIRKQVYESNEYDRILCDE